MDTAALASVEEPTSKKILLRLVPFVALMFFVDHLDRTAISLGSKSLSDSYTLPMFVVGGLMLLSAVLMVLLDRSSRRDSRPADSGVETQEVLAS